MAPRTQKALLLKSAKGPFTVETIDTPRPGPGEILVKVQATSLNPVDWKIQKYGSIVNKYPAVVGIDPAGDVEELGEGVMGVSTGDRVFFQAVLEPGNRKAAHQQYVIAKAETIPANYTYEDVATFPCAGGAAYLGLCAANPYGMGIPNPLAERTRMQEMGDTIVIIGGSSSVGQYVIQFSKLAGFSNIITTSSIKHIHALKSIGATHVIDRSLRFPAISAEISEITGGLPITFVFDAISEPDTQQMAYDLLAPSDGQLVTVLPEAVKEKTPGKTINTIHVLVLREDPENSKELLLLYRKISSLLHEGAIKPIRYEVLPNGLAGIPDGLERMEKGLISRLKLVARPHELP
ncbi:GroES-like protein [Amanita rubescens]|nr:GroES-like protein [Amanita rubescens]